MALLSLFSLFTIIALGFWRKVNVGLLAIAMVVILGYGSSQFSERELISGFSTSLFITLLGVTLFFSVVQNSGALEVVMKNVVRRIGGRIYLVPVAMFVMGYVLSAIGPGCVPALAFVAVIAVPLSHRTGYNSIMLMLIGDVATYSGRFSMITPEGVLVTQLMSQSGIEINLVQMMLNTGIGAGVLALIFFFAYGGHRVRAFSGGNADGGAGVDSFSRINPLSTQQKVVLLSIVLMVLCVVLFNMNVGLASFLMTVLLLLARVENEKSAISCIPWPTLIMVGGVGMLMNLVSKSGGIDIIIGTINQISTPATLITVTGAVTGIMSWFSSTIGVVLPTMLPTVASLIGSSDGAISAIELVSVIGIISSTAGFSPVSTVGALIMSANESDSAQNKIPQARLFITLFLWSLFCVVFLSLLAWLGVFGLF
ncbi:C4-dicarboxylate ABC transporter [Edwardsiella ictaluri]|uniref:Dicarboxylate carrier protein MatC N-terminus n=1 Tax=Edwardsiella ictaluri (strain 93-146) TaxID=634503 RepID=C5BD60_EDWI9|nr:SLC13 family permease [Edwardsiella ictaluri]ACR68555.1 Dicarboxylate carrier protein MatC N-terminus [Edwardsiella ictaluri 93-146]AVZ81132.1 C4-dicarboxylate ABC transporter [Edwardsiella ictaluri]EKS7763154.1 C4-dicarboxylate ABC transporter [Edwardsiella ictaluri]EKS7764929.1 C4-dicarboxylate ABC transporter [Edwardsiella ictaluri]EKS7770132.1 C4-dicarboxylate ABC transporter [Edwardsiella ictaluri]